MIDWKLCILRNETIFNVIFWASFIILIWNIRSNNSISVIVGYCTSNNPDSLYDHFLVHLSVTPFSLWMWNKFRLISVISSVVPLLLWKNQSSMSTQSKDTTMCGSYFDCLLAQLSRCIIQFFFDKLKDATSACAKMSNYNLMGHSVNDSRKVILKKCTQKYSS